MKKISVLLLCVFFSAVGWAQTLTTTFTNNNGSSVAVFSIENSSTTASYLINDIGSVSGFTGTGSAYLYAKTVPFGVAPGPVGAVTAANGWTDIGSNLSLATTGNTTTNVATPWITGMSYLIPPMTQVRFCIQHVSTAGATSFGTAGGQIRYSTVAAQTCSFLNGDLTLNACLTYGYGGTMASPTNSPRGFIGFVNFVAAAPCTGTPAPGNTISSAALACPSSPFNLTLQNSTGGSGVTYAWESADDMAFTTNLQSLGTASSQTIASQTSATYYRCIVTCAGNSTTSTPVFVDQDIATNCYCDPIYTSGGVNDGITNVTLGALSNSSTGNTAPYYTFYNTLTVPDLGQSTNADVSISFGPDGSQFAAVWIDFNQDGAFDATEGVVSTVNAGSNGTTIITVPVPAGALLGNTRMRVRGGNDSQLTTAQACGVSSSNFGEAEDYIVNITLPPACLATNGLINTVSNATTVQLDWDITASGSGYNWEIRTSGAPGSGAAGLVDFGNTATSLDTFVVSTALMPQTTYMAYVQTECGTSQSVWSSPTTFTTPCSTLALPWLDDVDSYTATTNATFDPTSCWSTNPVATTGLYRWNIGGSTGSSGTGALSANSGANFFFTEASSGGTGAVAELVSPIIDISTLTVPTLNYFLHMAGTAFGTLNIDINDGTGWVNDVAVVTGAQQAAQADPFIEQIVNLGAFTATGTVQVRFRAIRGGGFSGDICLDDISIVELPACTFPSALTAVPNSATSAILGWTENGTATAWNVIYGAPGFDPLTAGTTVPAAANPYTLTGLTAQTIYEFYVQSDCGGGTTSTLTGPFAFTTPCTSFAAPWTDDVELETATTNATFTASCWSTVPTATTGAFRWNITGSGTTPSSGTGATSAFSGTKFFYIEASSGALGNVAELYSPLVDLTALTTPALEFYTHMIGAQITDLRVDINDGTGWTNDVGIVSGAQQTAQGDPFTSNLINLSAYSGTIQVRFRVISGGTFAGDVCLDNISLIELPLCPDPSGVSATFVSSTSADIAWTENGTATSWTIEYGPTGFTPGSGTSVPAATNPFSVTGIPCGATYDFYVTSDCGINGTATSVSPGNVDLGPCPCTGTPAPGATISSVGGAACFNSPFDLTLTNTTVLSGQTYQWEQSTDLAFTTPVIMSSTTNTQNVPTPGAAMYYRCLVTCTTGPSSTYSTPVFVDSSTYCPCIPVYTTGKTDGDLIANVEIIGTTLANNSGTAPVNPAYTYFTGAPNLTATLTAGNSYNVSVSVGSFGSQQMAAWIDYNDDAIFDASEKIGFTTANIAAFGTAVFPIVLDCNPPLGTHRMRVRDIYFGNGSTMDPCATASFGEAEDYDVTIVAAAACPAPSGLSVISSTATSVELGWAIGCTETAWNILYGPVGFDPMTSGTTFPATNDTTTVTGLTCGTAYDFYVLADCGGAGPSLPSFSASGSTDGCPSLALTAMIEGYYIAGTGLMQSVIANSQFLPPTLECDSLTVELHDATSTLSVPVIAETFTGVLATDGTMSITWPVGVAGNSYYIVLKHRNALETWSTNPVLITATTAYDFTVLANVYGNNAKLVNPGVYALFSGNLNGDGFIDVGDYPVWETAANGFAFGYEDTDLTGDGLVDLSDYTVWEGNSNAFVFVFAPF